MHEVVLADAVRKAETSHYGDDGMCGRTMYADADGWMDGHDDATNTHTHFYTHAIHATR